MHEYKRHIKYINKYNNKYNEYKLIGNFSSNNNIIILTRFNMDIFGAARG